MLISEKHRFRKSMRKDSCAQVCFPSAEADSCPVFSGLKAALAGYSSPLSRSPKCGGFLNFLWDPKTRVITDFLLGNYHVPSKGFDADLLQSKFEVYDRALDSCIAGGKLDCEPVIKQPACEAVLFQRTAAFKPDIC